MILPHTGYCIVSEGNADSVVYQTLLCIKLLFYESQIFIPPSRFDESLFSRALNEPLLSNPFEVLVSGRAYAGALPADVKRALMVNLWNVIHQHMKLRNVKGMGPYADRARQMLDEFLEGKGELQKECLALYIEDKTGRMNVLFGVLNLFGYYLRPDADGRGMLSAKMVKAGMKLYKSFEGYMYSYVLQKGSKFVDLNCRQVMALIKVLVLVITMDYYYGHTNDTARMV